MISSVRSYFLGALLVAAAGCSTQPAAPIASPAPTPVDQLISQLESEQTRTEARGQLITLGAAAVPKLLTHVRHESVMVRWELANVLGPLADSRALPALVFNATADANSHVRWRSLWALSHFEKSAVAEALRGRLAEQDESTRWNAAVALSFFGIADGLDLLHAGVRNPDAWRRWEAINALGRVHDERSADVLAPALQSPALGDRTEAVLSLGMIGGAKSTALLIATLDDASPEVRWRACMALGRVPDPATLPVLRALDEKERDPQVREQLQLTLRKLENQTR